MKLNISPIDGKTINILIPHASYSKFIKERFFKVGKNPIHKEILFQVPYDDDNKGFNLFLIDDDTKKLLTVINVRGYNLLNSIDITLKFIFDLNKDTIELSIEEYILNDIYNNCSLEISEIDVSQFSIDILCKDKSSYIQKYQPKNSHLMVLYIVFDANLNTLEFQNLKDKLSDILSNIDLNKTIIKFIVFGDNNPRFIPTDYSENSYNFINDLPIIETKIISRIKRCVENFQSLDNSNPLEFIYSKLSEVILKETTNYYDCKLEKKVLIFSNSDFSKFKDFPYYYSELKSLNVDMFCISSNNNRVANQLRTVGTIAEFFGNYLKQKNKDNFQEKNFIVSNTIIISRNEETSTIEFPNEGEHDIEPVNANNDDVSHVSTSNGEKAKFKISLMPVLLVVLMVIGFSVFKNIKENHINQDENVAVYNSVTNSTEEIEKIKMTTEIKKNSTINDTTTSIITSTTPIITSSIQEVAKPNKSDFIYDNHNPHAICIVSYIGNDTEIYLPDYIDSLPVTSMISTAFQEHNNITKFIFNDNLEEIITDTSSDLQCFDGFKNLKMVYFGSSIKKIDEDYFDYCSSLAMIVVSPDNPYYRSDNGIVYSKDMSEIVLCPQNYPDEILKLPDDTLTVSDHCFEECINIKTLDLNNVIKIGNINFTGTKLIMKGDCILNSEIDLSHVSTIVFTSSPTQENIDYCKNHNIGYFVK